MSRRTIRNAIDGAVSNLWKLFWTPLPYCSNTSYQIVSETKKVGIFQVGILPILLHLWKHRVLALERITVRVLCPTAFPLASNVPAPISCIPAISIASIHSYNLIGYSFEIFFTRPLAIIDLFRSFVAGLLMQLAPSLENIPTSKQRENINQFPARE